jgi:hypothetical protein
MPPSGQFPGIWNSEAGNYLNEMISKIVVRKSESKGQVVMLNLLHVSNLQWIGMHKIPLNTFGYRESL